MGEQPAGDARGSFDGRLVGARAVEAFVLGEGGLLGLGHGPGGSPRLPRGLDDQALRQVVGQSRQTEQVGQPGREEHRQFLEPGEGPLGQQRHAEQPCRARRGAQGAVADPAQAVLVGDGRVEGQPDQIGGVPDAGLDGRRARHGRYAGMGVAASGQFAVQGHRRRGRGAGGLPQALRAAGGRDRQGGPDPADAEEVVESAVAEQLAPLGGVCARRVADDGEVGSVDLLVGHPGPAAGLSQPGVRGDLRVRGPVGFTVHRAMVAITARAGQVVFAPPRGAVRGGPRPGRP